MTTILGGGVSAVTTVGAMSTLRQAGTYLKKADELSKMGSYIKAGDMVVE